MPRRRDNTADLIDDAVDSAVGAVFDRATGFFERVRDNQRESFDEEYLRSEFSCVGCHKKFRVDAMEMLHPSNGFGTCRTCFRFMWLAAKEKMKSVAKSTARKATKTRAPRPQPNAAPQPPAGPPPWEVLGVAQDATMDEIKVAYRKKAMLWHPDRIQAGADAAEKERARAMFEQITRARDVMMSVRRPPEG